MALQIQHIRLNLVPFIVIDKDVKKVEDGILSRRIAPSILELMKIKQPKQMTGKSLLG